MLPELGPLDFAIVGEPTQMQLAIAERGLMVVDCTARGRSGHAAREEGDNAIYKGHAGHRVVPELPFPEGVRTVRGSQDDRYDHFGRDTAQRRAGRVPGSRSTSA